MPAVCSCFAQTPQSLFDTPFPSTYNGDDATPVPAVNSSQFHFPTITGQADQQQELCTYDQGFPAVSCGSGSEFFNLSFAVRYTPGATPQATTQDYAVHLSILTPFPNNITGVQLCSTLATTLSIPCALPSFHTRKGAHSNVGMQQHTRPIGWLQVVSTLSKHTGAVLSMIKTKYHSGHESRFCHITTDHTRQGRSQYLNFVFTVDRTAPQMPPPLLTTCVIFVLKEWAFVSGNSTGTDQPIFTVVSDTWLNLRTGIVSGLNYTQLYEEPSVYTFNSNYDGQVAQELTGRADATVYETVSPRLVRPACLVSHGTHHRACMCYGMIATRKPVEHCLPVTVPLALSIHQAQ